MSYDPRLLELYAPWRTCRACRLCDFRVRLIEGFGHARAPVMFVLDRLSVDDTAEARLSPDSPYLRIIWSFVTEAGKNPTDYWYTPSVACPTLRISGQEYGLETTPLPQRGDMTACRPRLHAEVGIVEPEIIVACGPNAAKAVMQTGAPSVQYGLGGLVEAQIAGEYGAYPVPLMLVRSPHELYTHRDLTEGGTWHTTSQFIAEAIRIAEQLRG